MDRQTNPYTCLTYMTTGCLLESLVTKKNLDGITHSKFYRRFILNCFQFFIYVVVVIDEVHERDEDTDLLLMIVKKLLFFTQNYTKVILMSATADPVKFCKYFATMAEGATVEAPIVRVPLVESHPVRVYHLDDLRNLNVSGFI